MILSRTLDVIFIFLVVSSCLSPDSKITGRAVQLLCKVVKGAMMASNISMTVERYVHVAIPRVPIGCVTSAWIACLTPDFVLTCGEGGEFLTEGNHTGIRRSEDSSCLVLVSFTFSQQLIALIQSVPWRHVHFFLVIFSDHLRHHYCNLLTLSLISGGLLLLLLHCRCFVQGWLHLNGQVALASQTKDATTLALSNGHV